MDDLTARLDRLEAQNHRLERWNRGLTWAAAVLALVVGTLVAVRWIPSGDTVRARDFVVLGADGNDRAFLSVDAIGTAALTFYGADKMGGASLQVRKDKSTFLGLKDTNERDRAILGVDMFGDTSLRLLDAEGRDRASLGVKSDGTPSLELYDKDGKAIWSAPTK